MTHANYSVKNHGKLDTHRIIYTVFPGFFTRIKPLTHQIVHLASFFRDSGCVLCLLPQNVRCFKQEKTTNSFRKVVGWDSAFKFDNEPFQNSLKLLY